MEKLKVESPFKLKIQYCEEQETTINKNEN